MTSFAFWRHANTFPNWFWLSASPRSYSSWTSQTEPWSTSSVFVQLTWNFWINQSFWRQNPRIFSFEVRWLKFEHTWSWSSKTIFARHYNKTTRFQALCSIAGRHPKNEVFPEGRGVGHIPIEILHSEFACWSAYEDSDERKDQRASGPQGAASQHVEQSVWSS